MRAIIGILIVIGCTLGGYAAMGAHLGVLWQPFEFVIIFGAAIGAFVITGPASVLKHVGHGLKTVFSKDKYDKKSYLELLSVMFLVFKIAKTKGLIALEKHIETPHESEIFSQFPTFQHDHHAVTFFCDYLRIISLGAESPHVIEDLIDQELKTHHEEHHLLAGSVQKLADGMPALGIVAAVLGVIKTMGSISEPPEVLGHLIGGALVGTFVGVWVAYGYVGPIAGSMEAKFNSEGKYFECMKAGLIAYLHGYPPVICVEYARKGLEEGVRPTFAELEETTNGLQVPA